MTIAMRGFLVRGMDSVARRVGRSAYHARHRDKARRALRALAVSKGRLDPAVRSQCDTYAHDVLGSRRYAPWLYVYTAMAGEFREGWMPDNFYGEVVVPQRKGAYGKLSSLKPLNTLAFGSSEAFPDLLACVNGGFFDRAYRWVPPGEVAKRLFAEHERVVFKPDLSSRGRGIRFLDRDAFDVREAARFGDGLYQAAIDQHASLAEFHAGSVATLRLSTVVEDGGAVSVRAAMVRFGTGEDTHVHAGTTVGAAVDPVTGRLGEMGFNGKWTSFPDHPTSGVAFAGRSFPAMDACRRLVTELHGRYPMARAIGWDLAVDRDGNPRVLEWNGKHDGIAFSEATQGPCFRGLGWERLRRPMWRGDRLVPRRLR